MSTNTLSFSVMDQVRLKVETEAGLYWRQSDFPDLPATAVSQAFSRLVKSGVLERVSKGVYYRSRQTRFGRSRPSQVELRQALGASTGLKPVGVSGANLLGFTTQNSLNGEFATSANSIPLKIFGNVRIRNRRPKTWDDLSASDAALLDFLRSRGKLSELSPEKTKIRLIGYFKEPNRFDRIAAIAHAEPPRVRAMIGAIGQEIGVSRRKLEPIRKSLSPFSRFDFGILKNLKYAKEWQAK